MANSQNGWPVLASGSSKLHTWRIPTKQGVVTLPMRNGSAGFLLAHFALFFADRVEPLVGKVMDDWGYANRPVTGGTVPSNHASGTAMDLNATAHVLGRDNTYSDADEARIVKRLNRMHNTIRWGGAYSGRKDEMHFEINQPLAVVEREARRLLTSSRGAKILSANPGQKKVILS